MIASVVLALTVFSWGGAVEIRELFAPEGKDPLVARCCGNEWLVEGDYGPGEGRIFEIRRK